GYDSSPFVRCHSAIRAHFVTAITLGEWSEPREKSGLVRLRKALSRLRYRRAPAWLADCGAGAEQCLCSAGAVGSVRLWRSACPRAARAPWRSPRVEAGTRHRTA